MPGDGEGDVVIANTVSNVDHKCIRLFCMDNLQFCILQIALLFGLVRIIETI